MKHTRLFRAALIGISAAVLAACPSSKRIKPISPEQPVISGPDRPTGTPHAIGTTITPGGGASYTVVPHHALPQWQDQQFIHSLKSFKLGCEKLKNRGGWKDVCAQAAQTPMNFKPFITLSLSFNLQLSTFPPACRPNGSRLSNSVFASTWSRPSAAKSR